MSSAEFEFEEKRVIGLRLPDGTEIWPGRTWHSRGVETAEDRRVIVEAIRDSARSLGIDESLLLEPYHWLVRNDKTYTIEVFGEADSYPLDTDSLLQDPEVVNAEADSLEEVVEG